MAETPSKLVSSVDLGSPDQVDAITSAAVESTADATILQSEIQDEIQSLLAKLASNATIAEDDPLKQIAETVPAVSAFITALEQSVFNAKAATPAGLILAQELKQGNITKEVFQSSVKAIDIDPAKLTEATAIDVPPALQKLLLSISNDSDLKKIEGILSASTTATPSKVAAQAETAFDPNDQEVLVSALEATINSLDSSSLSIEALQAAISDQEAKGVTSDSLKSLQDAFLANALKALEAKGFANLSASQISQISTDIIKFFNKTLSKLPKNAELQQIKQAKSLASLLKNIIKSNTLAAIATNANEAALKTKKIPAIIQSNEKGKASPAASKIKSEFKDSLAGLTWLEKLAKIAARIALQNLKASAASLLSINLQPRIVTGARAVIKINGKLTALCTNVTYNITMDWQELRGIDELLPNDLAPSSYSVSGSMSLYRMPDNSPIKNFIHSDMFRGMVWPYTTIEIRDKRTDELLVLVKRCAITSRSESYVHGQPVITTMNFVGIGFRDEQMPEFLPDKLEGSEGSGGLLNAITSLFKF